MKHFVKIFILAFLMMPFALMAQETGDLPPLIGPGSPLADLLEWTDLVYAALVIIGGYASAYIPGLKSIPVTVFRVFAIALILAAIFISMGWSGGFNVLFSYLAATGFYDLILSFLKKTPKPGDSSNSSNSQMSYR